MKIPAAALLFSLCIPCFADRKESEINNDAQGGIYFTTSVKRQLRKEGFLKAYDSATKITVQLVWSDEAASKLGLIVEERIQSKSASLKLSADHKKLLAAVINEDTNYTESDLNCDCIFQPQLRVVFFSETNETRYDILISGVLHGEIQAFRNKQKEAYARCGHFKPAYLKFLDTVFPNHELTKMLHQHNEQTDNAIADKNTIIERSPFLKHPGMLGTGIYVPLKSEMKFYEKIPEKERVTVSGFSANEKGFYESAWFKQSNPNATPESINAQKPVFSLSGHVGEYVSWFGILRAAEKSKDGYNLVIQNKYSTGMTDLHIQTVSIWGAGDFDALVRCQDFSLNPLVLVKVYGKVISEKNGRPLVDVEYLRYWNWLYFNFMDYGEDKKLSAYDKDLDLTGVRVYDSRTDPYYYPKRIQSTREQLDLIGNWLKDNRDIINKEYQDANKEE